MLGFMLRVGISCAAMRLACSQDLFLAKAINGSNVTSTSLEVAETADAKSTTASGDRRRSFEDLFLARSNNGSNVSSMSLEVVETADAKSASASGDHRRSADIYVIKWVGADGAFCLSTDGNDFREGQNIQLYWCRSAVGQLFRFHRSGRIQLDADPGLCVVTDWHPTWVSKGVLLGRCDFSDSTQQWRWDEPGYLESEIYRGKCIIVKDSRGFLYNNIELGDCHASWNNKWDALKSRHVTSSYIKWSGAERTFCLSTDGYHYHKGMNLRLDYCSPSNVGQHFRMTHNGLIQLDTDPSLCVVVDWGSSLDGANILLWSCDSNVAVQKWKLVGDVYLRNKENGKCIVVKDEKGAQHNNVVLGPCYGPTFWMTAWG